MLTVSGRPVLRRIALGPLHIYRREEVRLQKPAQGTPQEEWARFEEACACVRAQLIRMYEQASASIGEENAVIFSIHRLMLEDENFIREVRVRIEEEHTSAAYAARMAGESLAGEFGALEDDYMCARADDVRDVSRQVADALTGHVREAIWDGPPVILAADELSPSETMRLDPARLLGLVMRHGSVNSHASILASSMEVPVLLGVDFREDWEGHTAVMDGENNRLYVDPTPELWAEMQRRQAQQRAQRGALHELRDLPSVTRDGRHMALLANVGSEADVEAAVRCGAEGVGLLRSELLFMDTAHIPTEEWQFSVYKKAVQAMAGRPVTIRTLDVGADKMSPYVRLEPEENPALGMRGIRVSLAQPELLRTQLRAILRASAFGPVSVMLPMIVSVQEVRAVKEHLCACRAQLAECGTAMGETPLGVMIETPAAVMIAEELAQEADFFSVGTNDLTQYTLAIDRQTACLSALYEPRHPAILRMLRMVAQAGRRHGCRVCVCGELATDESLTEEFLRMGIDALSVAPPAILTLRRRVRSLDLTEAGS